MDFPTHLVCEDFSRFRGLLTVYSGGTQGFPRFAYAGEPVVRPLLAMFVQRDSWIPIRAAERCRFRVLVIKSNLLCMVSPPSKSADFHMLFAGVCAALAVDSPRNDTEILALELF
jgi:hypothetical protein